MTVSDWGPDSPAATRFRAHYDQPAPVEFECFMPGDLDGPDDERQYLLDEAPFAKQRAVRVEVAVPASTVAQGAANPPAPPESAIPSGNDGSGDLSPETVAELVALARVIDPDACDPPAKALPIADVNEVWRRQDTALLTARRVWGADYRLVSDDEATVDRVAAALWLVDVRTLPRTERADWGRNAPDDAKAHFRAMARAAVRALREAGQ